MNEPAEEIEDEPKPPRRHRGPVGLAAIALLVAVAAVVVVAWTLWHLQHTTRADAAARRQDSASIAKLESQIQAGDQQAQAGTQRIGNLESRLDDLRTRTQGLDRRLANLETAYATLSGQQQSGHDTLLLNDAEMLLRTAGQRYELFHDASGAVKAYTQAIDALAEVQNPAYAPVRASAITERDALSAAAPPSRQAALNALSALRSQTASLPLASAEPAHAASVSKPGFWSRVGHAFSGIVSVTRESAPASPPAATRFARDTLGLDLAQAQEALLAFDDGAYHTALQQADAVLAAQFDTHDSAVQAARTQIANLLSQRAAGPPPKLGGALAQLQALRASQTPPAPAPESTAGSAQ
ncbi:MAG: uroporphyrinogen-III C-methyltransferase [Rhodanobacteraceae bacterium]